jgi:ferredoxin--NADP+ reductase
VGFRLVHSELLILRVRPDGGRIEYAPGHYAVLGLGNWEPRVPGTQEEHLEPADVAKVVKRAYSICSPILDDAGRLVRPGEEDALEFYITLVRQATGRPPALTPRLFALANGSRLLIGKNVHGHYSLAGVKADDNVIFAATGTGEAPHNAMTAELLARGHRGRIVSVVCVRWRHDLAYLPVHRRLEQLYPPYRYVGLTTREPENLSPALPGYVGKRYVQDYFESGDIERETGIRLVPAHTHVYLCGNPQMIGVPHHTHDPGRRYPREKGMVEVLEGRGFHVDRPHEPGNIHFEKYW